MWSHNHKLTRIKVFNTPNDFQPLWRNANLIKVIFDTQIYLTQIKIVSKYLQKLELFQSTEHYSDVQHPAERADIW